MRFIQKHLLAVVASAAFLATAITYCTTMAPTVTFVDSGELISAAFTLGVAHPPGTPLYTLLGYIFTLLPQGNVAERVNFMSAIFGALAAASMVVLVGEQILSFGFGQKPGHSKPGSKAAASDSNSDASEREDLRFDFIASILFGGLLLGFSKTLWSYSTIAEVYSLNTFLIVAVFALVFTWRRESLRRSGETDTNKNKVSKTSRFWHSPIIYLYAAGFLFGLALGVHHVTVVLMLPAIAFVVLKTEGFHFFRTKNFLFAFLSAIAGLAIYLYLPLAASRSPLINWGDPSTAATFFRHVSGWQYQEFFSFSLNRMGAQFPAFFDIAADQFGTWSGIFVFALIAVGIYQLWRSDRTLLYFISLVFLFDLLIALNYDIAEDKDAYYLPVFVVLSLLAAIGTQMLTTTAMKLKLQTSYIRIVTILALLIVLEGVLVANLRNNNRSHFYLADDYVQNIYRSMEPNGMLLTTDWQVYSPALYKRVAENARPDLVVIDVNQMRRSWYFEYLDRMYPDVMQVNRQKENEFLDDLRQWEKDPARYKADVSLARRIDGRFRDLIVAMIASQSGRRRVYVTQEVGELFGAIVANRASNRNIDPASIDKDGPWVAALADTNSIVPRGLVFELTTEKTPLVAPAPDLEIRGLREAVVDLDRNDVVRQKVVPVYLKMAVNRGVFLLNNSRLDEARREFQQALDIDPNYAPAKQTLAQIDNRKGK